MNRGIVSRYLRTLLSVCVCVRERERDDGS